MPSSLSLRNRTIFAGLSGNVMEWYDFAVYGYFAPIIGRLFFPSENPVASLIAAYGAFAAGFLMRPVGGLVFGYVGDKTGRKAALTLSVFMMAIPTFLVGLLPDASQIGVAAPIIMVLLRMAQGLSVGGEYTTSIVFLVEHADHKSRGFMGSWSIFGAVAGILMGSAVSALLNTALPPEAIQGWGWRLPFLLGITVGVTGLIVRRHLTEPDVGSASGVKKSSPIKDAFRHEWPTMLRVVGFNIVNAVAFYMIFVYMATFLIHIVKIPASKAMDINTISMFVLLLVIPSAGFLSDRIGRKPLLLFSVVGLVLFGYPLIWLMHHDHYFWIQIGQIGFAVLVGIYLGTGPATMAESFPAHVRCSALSIGYNLCLAVFGGTTPMVAAYLIEKTHDDLSIAYYLVATAVISLFVVLKLPETAKSTLR